MVGYCYVCKVGQGERDNVSIHKLPTNEETRKIWFAFIGYKTGPNSGICSQHFLESDFIYKVHGDRIRRFLKPGACPSVVRPEDNEENTKILHEQNMNDCTSDANHDTNDSIPSGEHDTNVYILSRDHDTESNIILNTNIKLEDESYASIKIEGVTIEKMSPMVQIPLNSFSKTNSPQTGLTQTKRYRSPRYIGDLCREDFNTTESWNVFQKYVTETKRKLNSIKQENITLNKKVTRMQVIIDHLKKKGLICSDDRVCQTADNEERTFQENRI